MNDTEVDEEVSFAEVENIDVDTSVRGRALPSGPTKGTYHNPSTGQELILPNDTYSMEHYTKRHRLMHDPKKDGSKAFGVRLVYGPAPIELKEKWEQEGQGSISSGTVKADQKSNETKQLIDMVKDLSAQVAELKNQQLGQPRTDAYGIIEVEEKKPEPEYELDTQIPMFS